MTQTIEAFINRLHADGVEAGQEAAQRIVAEAEQRAAVLLGDAQDRANRLLEEARVEGERLRQRVDAELKLAARDTVLRLQDTLNRALRAVLYPAVREQLEDPQLLGALISELVERYAEANAGAQPAMVINVPEAMRRQLAGWVLEKFHGKDRSGPSVELQGMLADAGFECRCADGTVEVTTDAVVDLLADMVSPALWKRIADTAEAVSPENAGT